MYEWAAKVDEFARGMIGPLGSTLFEELGLYYIGPVDGHNIEDLICVLREVASLDSMGPVLVHVVTEENHGADNNQKKEILYKQQEGMPVFRLTSLTFCNPFSCFLILLTGLCLVLVLAFSSIENISVQV